MEKEQSHSPLPKKEEDPVKVEVKMGFGEAVNALLKAGTKAEREEWGGDYQALFIDGQLKLIDKDKKEFTWAVSKIDVEAVDYKLIN